MTFMERFASDLGMVTARIQECYNDFYDNGKYFLIELYRSEIDDLPYEHIIKEDICEALTAFRNLCEKYRKKRNKQDKDGETIKCLRELGLYALEKREGCSGIRRGIVVTFVTTSGNEFKRSFTPNEIVGTPKDIAEAIKDLLVNSYGADIEKGRERFYGLK